MKKVTIEKLLVDKTFAETTMAAMAGLKDFDAAVKPVTDLIMKEVQAGHDWLVKNKLTDSTGIPVANTTQLAAVLSGVCLTAFSDASAEFNETEKSLLHGMRDNPKAISMMMEIAILLGVQLALSHES
jgi:hypothetical protein